MRRRRTVTEQLLEVGLRWSFVESPRCDCAEAQVLQVGRITPWNVHCLAWVIIVNNSIVTGTSNQERVFTIIICVSKALISNLIDLEVEVLTESSILHELATLRETKIALSQDRHIVEPGVCGYVIQHGESVVGDRANCLVVDVIDVERVLENSATTFKACVGAAHREVEQRGCHVCEVVATRCDVGWRVLTRSIETLNTLGAKGCEAS